MSSHYIARRYGDQPETRSRSSTRSTSLAAVSRSRASSQAQDIAVSRLRCPTVAPSTRWSSILDHGNETHHKHVPSKSYAFRHPMPSHSTYTESRIHPYPTYTDALLKYSRRLRERSFSPTRNLTIVNTESYSPYKSNMDFYRGRVKSIYEKEPAFKDFYRNIPLSETNFYDNRNITRIKHRFNDLVQGKMGREQINNRYDPYTPSGRMSGLFTPMSEKLLIKHKAIPKAPAPLPFIYVYHRNTRK